MSTTSNTPIITTEYFIDRRLAAEELAMRANDVSKIPEETRDSLEMRFCGSQKWEFYEGFTVAALDVWNHLRYPDGGHLALRRVQWIASFILHRAGHLFYDLELPYPESLRQTLQELPPPARSTIQSLLFDSPCETVEYEQLKRDVPISENESLREYLQLDKPPLFYAGLFHGYRKLHRFFANVPDEMDVSLEQKADYAMSTAVFLADKIVSRKESETNAED
jgi:hypothetical protein